MSAHVGYIEVSSIENAEGRISARFSVVESFKGNPASIEKLSIPFQGEFCGIEVRPGDGILLFAAIDQLPSITSCTPTRKIASESPRLELLRLLRDDIPAKPIEGTFSIDGQDNWILLSDKTYIVEPDWNWAAWEKLDLSVFESSSTEPSSGIEIRFLGYVIHDTYVFVSEILSEQSEKLLDNH